MRRKGLQDELVPLLGRDAFFVESMGPICCTCPLVFDSVTVREQGCSDGERNGGRECAASETLVRGSVESEAKRYDQRVGVRRLRGARNERDGRRAARTGRIQSAAGAHPGDIPGYPFHGTRLLWRGRQSGSEMERRNASPGKWIGNGRDWRGSEYHRNGNGADGEWEGNGS